MRLCQQCIGMPCISYNYEGAIVEFSEVSYSVGEGDEFVIIEMVRFSDPSNEMVVAITLRETGREDSARGEERERGRERGREGGRGRLRGRESKHG